MGDFFAGLGGGMRFPDTQMNVGPLPSLAHGAPSGAHGDPDGRINFNSALLEGIAPYAGPDKGRVGSDRNYQQIPHRIQKTIHKIFLPSASHNRKFSVSHVVDQGDVACVFNTEDPALFLCQAQNVGAVDKKRLVRQTVFANLATANYMLAGMQRQSLDYEGWRRARMAFGWWDLQVDDPPSETGLPGQQPAPNTPSTYFARVERIVRTRILPFGICAGSEKQGGQTETGFAPVQAAANHVTTMTVDGQNIDLVNYWACENLNAGDQLILRLEWRPTQSYSLNHYYKELASQEFPGDPQKCWQLVPSVFRMGDAFGDAQGQAMPMDQFDYRTTGYWRIAQTMQHRKASCNDSQSKFWASDMCNLRHGGGAQLLQVLFAPVYYQMTSTERQMSSPRIAAAPEASFDEWGRKYNTIEALLEHTFDPKTPGLPADLNDLLISAFETDEYRAPLLRVLHELADSVSKRQKNSLETHRETEKIQQVKDVNTYLNDHTGMLVQCTTNIISGNKRLDIITEALTMLKAACVIFNDSENRAQLRQRPIVFTKVPKGEMTKYIVTGATGTGVPDGDLLTDMLYGLATQDAAKKEFELKEWQLPIGIDTAAVEILLNAVLYKENAEYGFQLHLPNCRDSTPGAAAAEAPVWRCGFESIVAPAAGAAASSTTGAEHRSYAQTSKSNAPSELADAPAVPSAQPPAVTAAEMPVPPPLRVDAPAAKRVKVTLGRAVAQNAKPGADV